MLRVLFLMTFIILFGLFFYLVNYLETNSMKTILRSKEDGMLNYNNALRPNDLILSPNLKYFHVNNTSTPNILAVLWSSIFPKKLGLNGSTSYIWNNVEITYNRTRLSEADFIFIHFMDLDDIPKIRRPWQRLVLHTLESPAHSSVRRVKPAELARLDNLFNFTSHYSYKASINSPYGRCSYVEESVLKTNLSGFNKTGLVLWAASHCVTESKREKYIHKLNEHIQVDMAGKCGKIQHPRKGFEKVLKKYKFYLAFENSFCQEYVTEKFYNIIARPGILVIPVVMGLGSYGSLISEGSYIDVRNFTSPSHLAEYLHYLDSNDTAFMEYFTARRNYECIRHGAISAMAIGIYLTQLADKRHIVGLSELKQVFGIDNCISATDYYKRYDIKI